MEPTNLHTWLNHLQTSGLINPAPSPMVDQFIFRHALVQDAAYASLLRQDRKRLHRAIALVLERNGADRLDELSPVLGEHFAEAGETQRAIDYLGRAGHLALQRYAIPESLMHFSQALKLTEAHEHLNLRFALLIARGQAHEMLSSFDPARDDYEAALSVAQQAEDAVKQCHAFIKLGMLWAGRDYTQSEYCFNQAHTLATTTGDKALLAMTLNRIGNCHINRDQAELAITAHQRALELFEEMHDESGLLETLDYLGMASGLGGDMTQSSHYYDRSIALAARFDDRPRMIVGLTISAMGSSPTFQSNSLSPADITPPGNMVNSITRVRQALEIAQTSHLKSEEAYCLATLAMAYCAHGEMGKTLDYADQSLKLACSLEHKQWMVFAHISTGQAMYTMLDFASAQTDLETGLALAEGVDSWHWRRVASCALASNYIAQSELGRAAMVLDRALPPGTPARTLGQRLAWSSRVELALAEGKLDLALQYIELLLTDVPLSAKGRPILRVYKLHGHVLAMRGELRAAEEKYQIALQMAHSYQSPSEHWHILTSLSLLYRQLGDMSRSDQMLTDARVVAHGIAATIVDPARRQIMLAGIAHYLTPAIDIWLL